jgi:putative FmdB family regulatory protein
MPLYEYKCSNCNSHVEVVQKVNDQPLKKCPKCGGALKKLLSAPGLQFKGKGWYVTDYGEKKKPEKEEKPKKKPKTEKTDSTKNTSSVPSAE